MVVEVIGKSGLTITEAIKDYAKNKMAKLENHFNFKNELNVRVLCKVYKDHHKVEVTIPSKHFTLRTEVVADTLYAALDSSVDKLQRQIRKFKTKVNKILRKREGVEKFFNEDVSDDELLEKEYLAKNISRIKKLDLHPMSTAEAMDQIDMIGHDFYIYLDEQTSKVNVLYIRSDGDYAIIETS